MRIGLTPINSPTGGFFFRESPKPVHSQRLDREVIAYLWHHPLRKWRASEVLVRSAVGVLSWKGASEGLVGTGGKGPQNGARDLWLMTSK